MAILTAVSVLNLYSRPIPTTPHQFGKLAAILRGKKEIYSGMTLEKYQTWLVSAQPSRSASLLQEHDCPVQFIPNPQDFRAIEKAQIQSTAVAVKYSGLAELEGFILPTYRIVVVTDKEFFGQQSLVTARLMFVNVVGLLLKKSILISCVLVIMWCINITAWVNLLS